MKKMITIALITLAVAAAQAAEFVSLNLYLSWLGQQISNGESFGSVADGTVTTNWSNHSGDGWDTTLWNDGTQSSVGYVVSGNGGYAAYGFGNNDTPMTAGRANFATSDPLATLSMTNLTANFSEGYDVIVYLTGHVDASEASITDGTTTYYFNTPDAKTSELIQVTSTSDTDYETGSYVKFTGLFADTFTVEVSLSDASWVGIGGLQIIPGSGPPPAEPALGLYIIH